MKDNSTAIVRKITSSTLSADKKRNFFIIAAIALTSFMIASVFSVGMSYLETINMQEMSLEVSISHNYESASTYITLGIITALLVLTGYLLIYNVMHISISKDVRFYGMMKTVGTTTRQIRRIVKGQLVRLCIIGLPIGMLAAAVVSMFVVPAVIKGSGVKTGAVVSFSLARDEDKCIIIVTHSKKVTSVADEVYEIKDGQLSAAKLNRKESRSISENVT